MVGKINMGKSFKTALAFIFLILIAFSCSENKSDKTVTARSPVTQADANSPDIVFIVMDTLRFDALLDPMTSKVKNSPIAHRMKNAAIYTNAYSTSCWTIPAHASMFSGLLPNQHHADQTNWTLSDDILSVQEILAQNGYHTVGITENPMLNSKSGFAKGFTNYLEPYRQWKPEYLFKEVDDLLLKALDEKDSQDKPVYIFVNIMNPHWPYWPPHSEFDKNTAGRSYLSSIYLQTRYTIPNWYLNFVDKSEENLAVIKYLYDRECRIAMDKTDRILKTMDQKRNRKRLVILVSDHGENFGEHGHRDHVFSLNEELVHVPIVLLGEDINQREDLRPVSLVDIFPTILAAAKIDAPPNEGQSLLEAGDPNRPCYFAYAYPKQVLDVFKEKDQVNPLLNQYKTSLLGVKSGDWKFVVNELGNRTLFNLTEDPYEMINLERLRPEVVEKMSALLKSYKAKQVAVAEPDEMKLDRETEKSLRSLGYLQ